jgi:hypothetical protein
MSQTKVARLSVQISRDELKAIDDFRIAQGISTRAAAVRAILKRELKRCQNPPKVTNRRNGRRF